MGGRGQGVVFSNFPAIISLKVGLQPHDDTGATQSQQKHAIRDNRSSSPVKARVAGYISQCLDSFKR